MLDIFSVADAVRADVDETIPPIEAQVAGTSSIVPLTSGMQLPASRGFHELADFDVVIVPALGSLTGPDTRARLDSEEGRAVIEVVRELDTSTVRLGAACTGVFALAESGHLDGRRATTSWFLGAEFRRRYPDVDVDLDQMVVTDGPILTAGAAFAHVDLALSILRMVSSDLARHVGQLLVIDERPSQAVFMAHEHVQHDDAVVIEFERHVRAALAKPFEIGTAAAAIGTSRRTLERRVREVLGLSPLGFVQRLRLERARHLKATTDQSLEEIAPRVGYANVESLRALMRRHR
ncbi:MAG: helix-turn-helix domain-containing protein [Acidobacteriota bacterium]